MSLSILWDRLSSEEGINWKDEGGSCSLKGPSPASIPAPHAWLNRVTQEEEGRKRRGIEEEEEGRKGLSFTEEREDEGRGKTEMQEKLNKLFGQAADPWASAGEIQRKRTRNSEKTDNNSIEKWDCHHNIVQ